MCTIIRQVTWIGQGQITKSGPTGDHSSHRRKASFSGNFQHTYEYSDNTHRAIFHCPDIVRMRYIVPDRESFTASAGPNDWGPDNDFELRRRPWSAFLFW